ncbi:MAG: Rieske 2Fe-2S domain-containing protein [Acidobacteria bacterium]|nr:Rieske 2Fe-2S domain-containing protein [Acidobacteriota bacterium]MBI3423599.1 Rieske 2Fe-2S domain-containing protein [Acidobacteriota bacterium]
MTRAFATATESALTPPATAFPTWPFGWYLAAQAAQVTQQPLSLDLFGRRLVAYRTGSGQAVVLDARCWHLGADLAKGCVRGDQIVCPFHGWRFGADGQCAWIPTQAHIPRAAQQQAYCTAERAGRVFVFPAATAAYPLPFFAATEAAELSAAPPFEFTLDCPWWLIGTNGFDVQHFAAAHDRHLVSTPTVTTPHPAARRIVATFEVSGANWRDRLTRRLAGRRVTMDVTVWSGTLAFTLAHFHDTDVLRDETPRTTSYGMTEIRPLTPTRSLVRVTIWRRRRPGWRALDQCDVRVKRHFIRAFLKPDTQLLNDVHYDPAHLIGADRQLVDYLRWLASASRGVTNQKKEPQ